MIFVFILLAILILMLMVTIHEFGHYLAGKILGFKINEFSVGFGPKILGRKSKKTGEEFSVRAVPLGGYCAFYGEEGDESVKNEQFNNVAGEKNLSFNEQKPWKRIIVLLSGALFNLFSAFIFSFIYILAVGYSLPVIDEIYNNPFSGDSYASELRVGDKIVAVEDVELGVMNSFAELTSSLKVNESITITVIRDGKKKDLIISKQKVMLIADENNYESRELFGFKLTYEKTKVSPLYAIGNSFPFTFKMAGLILSSFGQLFTGQVPISELSGPIGTVATIATYAEANLEYLLLFLPLIASNLAIFNILPIPSLDGSKIVFTIIEWVRGKPINRKVEGYLHGVGLILLLIFVVVIDLIGIILRFI